MNPRLPLSLLALLAIATVASAAEIAQTRTTKPPVVNPATAEVTPLPDEVAAGLAEAAKSGRDVFVVLNVSDWDGWCGRIRRGILEKPAFKTGMAKDFVIVSLDYPQNKPLPPEPHRRNLAYAQKYHITGFPVVLLLDSTGRAYARSGYSTDDETAYVKAMIHLKATRVRRDTDLAKAVKNKGDIRADLLARALRMVDGSLVQDYSPLFEDLRSTDPADRRGVLADYDINMLFIRASESERTTHTLEAPLWEFDAFLDAHPALAGEKRQRVLLERFGYVARTGNLDGLSPAARCERRIGELRDMLALAPSSPHVAAIKSLLDTEQTALEKIREAGADLR